MAAHGKDNINRKKGGILQAVTVFGPSAQDGTLLDRLLPTIRDYAPKYCHGILLSTAEKSDSYEPNLFSPHPLKHVIRREFDPGCAPRFTPCISGRV
jgi:hypothetical protein